MSTGNGRRVIQRTQRSPNGLFEPGSASSSLSLAAAVRAARLPGFGRSRSPTAASAAGTRVTDTSTATRTITAAAMPITVRNGSRATARPSSAMITVVPAKTTDDPAVAVVTAIESRMLAPRASSDR